MNVTNESGIEHLTELRRQWPYTPLIQENDLCLVGSTSINGYGNDIDVAMCCDDLCDAADTLRAAGWEVTDAEVYRGISDDGWFSAKFREWNLLVAEPEIYELWKTADRACRVLRLIVDRDLTRDERVLMHKAVFND